MLVKRRKGGGFTRSRIETSALSDDDDTDGSQTTMMQCELAVAGEVTENPAGECGLRKE